MIDIVSIKNGLDIGINDTQVPKATNILSIQLGSLEYEPDFGIDLKYFLSEGFKFQNESFKAYLVEALANQGINVASVTEIVRSLDSFLSFYLEPEDNTTGLVAR